MVPELDPRQRPSEPATPAPPSVAPLLPLPWRTRLAIWAALQFGGAATLAAAALLVSAVAPLFGGAGPSFLQRWGLAFVLLPATFIPALVIWHRYALARYGKRATLFRVVAEIAFATELVACVLYQNIA